MGEPRRDHPSHADEEQHALLMNEDNNQQQQQQQQNSPGASPHRPVKRADIIDYSCCEPFVNSRFYCNNGYRMDPFLRNHSQAVDYNMEKETNGLVVGMIVKEMQSYGVHVLGLVRPLVKVHAVDIETGNYIKSKPLPSARPQATKVCPLKEFHSHPNWDEELVISAFFSDVASENCVLLFEILDDKPSLDMKKRKKMLKKPLPAKRIAWAYLLPIGISGRLTIGLNDDWKASFGSNSGRDRNANNNNNKQHSKNDSGRGGGVGGNSSTSQLDVLDHGHVREHVPGNNTAHNVMHQRAHSNSDRHLRLQLYEYRRYDGVLGFLQRKTSHWPVLGQYVDNDEEVYPGGIPEVYLQWRLKRKVPIPECVLSISIGPRVRDLTLPNAVGVSALVSAAASPTSRAEENPFVSRSIGAGVFNNYLRSRREPLPLKSKAELLRIRTALNKRTRRNKDEPCIIPDKLLYNLETGPEGAMVVRFSHSGHLLAVATRADFSNVNMSSMGAHMPYTGSIYSIKLYDVDFNEEVWCEPVAHHGVIYDLKWSKDDQYLLSCSGDSTCKIWEMSALLARHRKFQRALLNSADPNIDDPWSHNSFDEEVDNKDNIGSGTTAAADENAAFLRNSLGDSIEAAEGGFILTSKQLRSPKSHKRYPFPALLHTMTTYPPVFVYSAIFQEFASPLGGGGSSARAGGPNASVQQQIDASMDESDRTNGEGGGGGIVEDAKVSPCHLRVISGSSDGRIRVWEAGEMLGFISPTMGRGRMTEAEIGKHDNTTTAHEGSVNSLVIDERSRYLISGDSFGEMFAWRIDKSGWYQMLRKFRKDIPQGFKAGAINADDNPTSGQGNILSLSMHPERSRGQMLILSRLPATLRLLNLTSYKNQSSMAGYGGMTAPAAPGNSAAGAPFARASMSADGNYTVCGANYSSSGGGSYKINAWETQTGYTAKCDLSELMLPFAPRSICWHPTQHLLAVGMVGQGASVAVYCTNRESSEKQSERRAHFASTAGVPLPFAPSLGGTLNNTMSSSLRPPKTGGGGGGANNKSPGTISEIGVASTASSVDISKSVEVSAEERERKRSELLERLAAKREKNKPEK